MTLSRRDWLKTAAALPLVAGATPVPAAEAARPVTLPDKASFHQSDVTWLDSGATHPISLAAERAAARYVAKRALDPTAASHTLDEQGVLAKFARLINADPREVTFVQSTTAGEKLIVDALGLPESGAHIVTDTLHFFGSFPLYQALAKQGCDVTWLRQDGAGRIAIDAVERAVRPGTRLVALSLVATYNGFQHDLKKVCEIAHAKGALVYADIVHAAGCIPVDVKASGVDFAACSSYKWLMADFGLGFLYVRADRLDRLKRVHYGYYGLNSFQTHVYPLDPPGEAIADYGFSPDTTGMFAQGTYSHTVAAMLDSSLDYIQGIGVERIQAHAQRLIARLHDELPRLGLRVMTPRESATPLISWAADGTQLANRLRDAKIRVSAARNRVRVSVSVFNDMDDIDRLLHLLKS